MNKKKKAAKTSKKTQARTLAPKDTTKKLREMNAALTKEVARRKRLEEDLRERTKNLEEADRKKNEFLAVLSHELRNPLAPIVATVEAAKLRETTDPETKNDFDTIGRQADQMARLLKDLLDVSRILYGKIELAPEYIDIREVVRRAIESTQYFISQHRHTLSLTLPDEPIHLFIDPLRIEQILMNLIFNAAKYTEPGGTIQVDIFQQKENETKWVCVTVKDNGVGIKPEVLPKIFDLFTQGDGVLKRTKSGIGIGLFLSRQLAELHGGTVTAQSEGSGKGSAFTLCLPSTLKKKPEPAPEPQTTPEKKMTADNMPKRILVVDDNQDAANSLAKLMTYMGHTVEKAYSGQEALLAAKKMIPDIAFIDIAMPKMNGYQVAQKIREDKDLSEIKLVALTGFGQKTDRENAIRAGFDLHCVKPITLPTLKGVIDGAADVCYTEYHDK